jgi:hypothetical protein
MGSGEHRSPDFQSWGVRPMVRTPWDAWCWCPLRHEVSKDLTLDGVARLEVELNPASSAAHLAILPVALEL